MNQLPSRLTGLLFLVAGICPSLYAYKLLNLHIPVDSSTYPGRPLPPQLRLIGGIACLALLALPAFGLGLRLIVRPVGMNDRVG